MMKIMTAKFHVNKVCGLGKNCLKYALPPPLHVKWNLKFPCKIGLNYFTNCEKVTGPIRAKFLQCVLGI